MQITVVSGFFSFFQHSFLTRRWCRPAWPCISPWHALRKGMSVWSRRRGQDPSLKRSSRSDEPLRRSCAPPTGTKHSMCSPDRHWSLSPWQQLQVAAKVRVGCFRIKGTSLDTLYTNCSFASFFFFSMYSVSLIVQKFAYSCLYWVYINSEKFFSLTAKNFFFVWEFLFLCVFLPLDVFLRQFYPSWKLNIFISDHCLQKAAWAFESVSFRMI